jgi:branched-chain amino acid transport system permease protein
VALGFGLIFRTTRVFHIAHGAIYTLAGFSAYFFMNHLKWPLIPDVVLSIIFACLVGILTEAAVYWPLEQRGASSPVMMISSLGVYIICVNAIAMVAGNENKTLQYGIDVTTSIGSVVLTRIQIAQLVGAPLVIAFYWAFLRLTRLGRICRAVADDSTLAAVLGVRVKGVRISVFAVGSLLAATGAILAALDIGIDPQIGFNALVLAAVACIIGGLHHFIGPALGGFLLGLIQSLVAWRIPTKWESSITFALLIVFLLFRPQGLLGIRKRLEED